jgi:hypothetical protein
MFEWQIKAVNSLSLMNLCSALTGIKDVAPTTPDHPDTAEGTFSAIKRRIKLAVFNSILMVKLGSEKRPERYFGRFLEFLEDSLGLQKVIVIVRKQGEFHAFALDTRCHLSVLELAKSDVRESFEASVNFLKLQVNSTDTQKKLLHLLTNESMDVRHFHSVYRETHKKGTLVSAAIGYFVTRDGRRR